jgi:cytidylate kinase
MIRANTSSKRHSEIKLIKIDLTQRFRGSVITKDIATLVQRAANILKWVARGAIVRPRVDDSGLRDLPFPTERAIGRLMERWHHQDQRIRAYKEKELSDFSVHDLVIRSTDVRACTPRQIPAILREWRNPRHEEFHARTLWSLFNGFTEILKGNLNELPKRTEALHGLLDLYVGLANFSHN